MHITLRFVWYNFSSRLRATLSLCLIYFKITWALAILLDHMHKKFEINQTKIKGGCQSGRKVVPHNSKSDWPLVCEQIPPITVVRSFPQLLQTFGWMLSHQLSWEELAIDSSACKARPGYRARLLHLLTLIEKSHKDFRVLLRLDGQVCPSVQRRVDITPFSKPRAIHKWKSTCQKQPQYFI